MLKRDSLTAQMQQLSMVLAKVKRLIIEDHEPEAMDTTLATFIDYFAISREDLLMKSEEEFIQLIKEKNFVPEEVSLLAYFIDEYAGLQDEFKDQLILYKKLIRLFDYLELELQFIAFDHISRRSILESQLSQFQ